MPLRTYLAVFFLFLGIQLATMAELQNVALGGAAPHEDELPSVSYVAQPPGEVDLGFLERFALAEDRGEVLKELVPGTLPYYYFRCLHLQEQGAFDEVDALLVTWVERHGDSPQVIEIRHRQALLRYDSQPADTLEYLKSTFQLQFNHQRQVPGVTPDYPTALDPTLIERETLREQALKQSSQSDHIDAFNPSAYDWLLTSNLAESHLRSLLGKLQRPDYPQLAEHIAADLNGRNSGGFGSLPIHTLLTKGQLDTLLQHKPELRNDDTFVQTYVRRLVPSADNDQWRRDPEAMKAYLDRLEGFVEGLAPAHHTLKAHVRYHRLAFDQSQGIYDAQRFLTYLRIPRHTPYVHPDMLKKVAQRNHVADLQRDFGEATVLPPVRNDNTLVSEYLRHFFAEGHDIDRYRPYVRESFLRTVFAETQLLRGTGDMEQWYSWLSPDAVEALKARVDVNFAPENQQQFAQDEAVTVDVLLKNVDRLLVKVYEIDTLNYYREFDRGISTDINLDGLVANHEEVYTYDEVPLRQHRRTFSFPEIKGKGVWIIELVGNGASSRALISKGSLQYLSHTGPTGPVFTLFDETGRRVTDGSIWFAGRHYPANDDGRITLPFSTDPGTRTVLLCQGDFATRAPMEHLGERYRLRAGIHVDSESIRSGKMAQVVLRPLLYLNGRPMPLSLLRDPTLEVYSDTHDGVKSTQRIDQLQLKDDAALVESFRVPANLSQLSFTFRATVQPLTQDAPQELKSQQSVEVNGILTQPRTASLFLHQSEQEFSVEVRDTSGNPLPDHALYVRLHHRDFVEPVDAHLKTDEAGRAHLGSLPDIVKMGAYSRDTTRQGHLSAEWKLPAPTFTYPSIINGSSLTPLRIPYTGQEHSAARRPATLLEMNNGTYMADRSDALRVEEGYLIVSELPPGDYLLHLKEANRQITLRLTESEVVDGQLASTTRVMDAQVPTPLQIQSVDADDSELRIQLAGANALTQVHIVGSHFLPARLLAHSLDIDQRQIPAMRRMTPDQALYTNSRPIGDEYRYVLERRFATKYPGNMLERPGLLLTPWAIEETQASQEAAEEGAAIPSVMADEAASPPPASPAPSPARTARLNAPLSPAFDFLDGGMAVAYNLIPDEQGLITLPREALQGRNYLQIVATDPTATVSRPVALPATPWSPRDLRLADGLAPDRHVVEHKRVKLLAENESLTIDRTGDVTVQLYDSVPSVLNLLSTLSRDPQLQKFQFVGYWPSLSAEEKAEKFSQFASHELNFFLYHKDREFFDATVRPFLENKFHKTFLDRWLLAEDLSPFLDPWQFEQLNRVEQILLSKRFPEGQKAVAEKLRDVLDMMPPNPALENMRFMTALHGTALRGSRGRGDGIVLDGSVRIRGNFYDSGSSPYGPPGNGGFDPRAAGFAGGGGAGFGVAFDRVRESIELKRQKADKDASTANLMISVDDTFLMEGEALDVARSQYRALYRAPETTKALIETNYYERTVEATHSDIIPVNAFWADYASAPAGEPFFTTHLAQADSGFTEAMMALAVLDVPFESPQHTLDTEDSSYTVQAAGRAIAYFKNLESADVSAEKTPVLVSQNYFQEDDRYRFEGNQQHDKFVTDEFLTGPVYGCQVVVTNPTSTPYEFNVLHQLPEGALPVNTARYTQSVPVSLGAYSTHRLEYYFYFPEAGTFTHFPAHISQEDELLAFAEGITLNVVEEASQVDTSSWEYIAHQADSETVLDYLKTANLNRIELVHICWRLKDQDFFVRVIDVLNGRRVYAPDVWSYAIHHNNAEAIRTYLAHRRDLPTQVGPVLDSPLLQLDPVERRFYQHMEFAPLINPRAHHPNGKWMITNGQLMVQYRALLNVLAHRNTLRPEDHLALSYYFLLQDRVEDGLAQFAQLDPSTLPTRIQYDYLHAYVKFYQEDPEAAVAIATPYAEYPVEAWRDRFTTVLAQAAAIRGEAMVAAGQADQDRLASEEPQLNLALTDKGIQLDFQNLTGCTISFYPIDLEMLFSRSPFELANTDVIAGVKPMATVTTHLDPTLTQHTVPLPEDFAHRHVIIKADANGLSRSEIRYASEILTQRMERYGQIRVTRKSDNTPLPKVYVKVFARLQTGEKLFYRDGYTDLRGRFDYASSSTLDLNNVAEFSLLVTSEELGANVLTAAPPAR